MIFYAKVVDLEFEESGPSYPLIDVLTFDYSKLKLEDNMKITYNEKPYKINLKSVCAYIIKGHCLKRNTYFQIMSIGFSDLVWKIFASLINLTNERNNKLKFFTDPILIKINCNRKLSLNKMTYFDDLVIPLDKVCDTD